MTSQKLRGMVSDEVASAISIAITGMKKEIVDALKTGKTLDGQIINIEMNNPNFASKSESKQKLDEMTRLI